jgi:hypothetical protein
LNRVHKRGKSALARRAWRRRGDPPAFSSVPGLLTPGDFNGDGSSDLLVANNGDGRIVLLIGGPDGLDLSTTFARADVPHPTDLALVSNGVERDVYVAEEGRESALLLTAFGVAVPVLVVAEPPSTGVLVVNGPGIERGIDVPALPAPSVELLQQRSPPGRPC